MLRQKRDEFNEMATKYCRGYMQVKKKSRFDKMEKKERLGFKLEEFPIKKQFRKVDSILTTLLKKQTFY